MYTCFHITFFIINITRLFICSNINIDIINIWCWKSIIYWTRFITWHACGWTCWQTGWNTSWKTGWIHTWLTTRLLSWLTTRNGTRNATRNATRLRRWQTSGNIRRNISWSARGLDVETWVICVRILAWAPSHWLWWQFVGQHVICQHSALLCHSRSLRKGKPCQR